MITSSSHAQRANPAAQPQGLHANRLAHPRIPRSHVAVTFAELCPDARIRAKLTQNSLMMSIKLKQRQGLEPSDGLPWRQV